MRVSLELIISLLAAGGLVVFLSLCHGFVSVHDMLAGA